MLLEQKKKLLNIFFQFAFKSAHVRVPKRQTIVLLSLEQQQSSKFSCVERCQCKCLCCVADNSGVQREGAEIWKHSSIENEKYAKTRLSSPYRTAGSLCIFDRARVHFTTQRARESQTIHHANSHPTYRIIYTAHAYNEVIHSECT